MAEAEKKVDKAVLVAEVISPVALQLNRFLDYMPNPDLLLQDTGESLEIYRRMMLDDRIISLLEVRKAYALTYPWKIIPGDDTPQAQAIVDDISKVLKKLNMPRVLKELLSAEEFGFSLAEIGWEISDGRYVPAKIKSWKPERFTFKTDETPVLMSGGGKVALDMPYKFIVHRHNPGAENPYGSSLLKACYWPWMFKKAGWRFWLTAAEKFGVPTVFAIFETDDEEKARTRAAELSAALAGIQSDAAVALGNIKQIDTLEIKGSLADFEVLIKATEAAMSHAITGQSLATGEASYDTLGASQTQEGILEILAQEDDIQLGFTMTETLVAYMTELNYGPDAPKPEFAFDIISYASIENVFGAIDRKIPVSKSELYGRYHLPRPKDNEPDDAFVMPENTAPPDISLADNAGRGNPAPTGKKKRRSLHIYSRR